MNRLIRKNYPELGEVKAPYVHSVRHGDTLYISGLTAFGTPAQQSGIVEQAEEIFSQICKIVTAEGADFSSSLKSLFSLPLLTRLTRCARYSTAITAITCLPVRWWKSAVSLHPISRLKLKRYLPSD